MAKVSTIFKFIIVICTMIMLRYLLLIPGTRNISSPIQRGTVLSAGLILMVLTCFLTDKKDIIYFKWLLKYIKPYFCVMVFSLAYTFFLYDYSIKSLIVALIPFSYVLFAFPLIYIFCCDKDCFKFIKTVTLLQLIIMVLKIIGWYTYNYSKKPIFADLTLEFEDWTRNGLQRVEWGQLYGLALVFCTYYACKEKRKIGYIIIVAGMIWYVSFVSQARYTVAVAVVTVGTMLYFMYRRGVMKWGIRLLIIVAIIAVLASGFISQIYYDASVNGQYARSTSARLENVQHYYEIMQERHSVLGLGLLDTSNSSAYSIMYKNEVHNYYLDDIGLLGGVVRFGLLFLVVYGWLFVLIIKTCLRCYKNRSYDYLPFLIGLAVYIIATCLLQNIYDSQRAYAMPFYLASISYIDGKISISKA